MFSKIRLVKRRAAPPARLTPSVSTDSGCSELQTSLSEPDHQQPRPESLGNQFFPSGSWQVSVTREDAKCGALLVAALRGCVSGTLHYLWQCYEG